MFKSTRRSHKLHGTKHDTDGNYGELQVWIINTDEEEEKC